VGSGQMRDENCDKNSKLSNSRWQTDAILENIVFGGN